MEVCHDRWRKAGAQAPRKDEGGRAEAGDDLGSGRQCPRVQGPGSQREMQTDQCERRRKGYPRRAFEHRNRRLEMKRGDLVTVVMQGAYGKPRPAVVVQADLCGNLNSAHGSCRLASEVLAAPDISCFDRTDNRRMACEAKSQVMADKCATLPLIQGRRCFWQPGFARYGCESTAHLPIFTWTLPENRLPRTLRTIARSTP